MRSAKAIILSDYVGGDTAASGGAGHAALDSFRALRAKGIDVRIIAAFGGMPDVDPDRFTSLGCADLREGCSSGAALAVYNPRARAALATLLADEDPDRTIVILHQWTRALSPSSIGLLGRFRVMVYMHDYFWPCPNGAYYDFQQGVPCDRKPLGIRCVAANCDRSGRAHKIGRLVRHAALRAVTRGQMGNRLFLSISDHSRETAVRLIPKGQHAILHNPLGVTDRPASPPIEPRFDIGYFGRLEPEKGLAELIPTADRLNLSGLFVGEGAFVEAIAARPRLELRHWQPRDAIAQAMRSCRVIVLPSLWPETWGLVVPEAMQAGVPVLVSCRAGSAELVERFGGGMIFDPSISGDLERKLAQMLENDMPSRELAVHDWAAFAEFLSADRHASRIVELAAETWSLDLRVPSRVARPAGSISLQA
ncbi:MAG: glycosyltransferase [Sphingomonadales bacterium]|nr:glycosyltransferase [Sphingomonadales bacterium]